MRDRESEVAPPRPATGVTDEVAVTGPTGLIGRWLLLELTRQGVRVQAFMRRPAARIDELRAWLDARGGRGDLVEGYPLDLMSEDLGLDPAGRAALGRARVVFHLAAVFGFGLDRATAHRANVAAGEALVAALAGLPKLERLVHVSGYRTAGGPARALDVDDEAALTRFYAAHGAYEASKMEAHARIPRAAAAAGVPVTVVSPSSVIGDSESGETTQVTGLGDLIEKLWRGQLPAIAGDEDTWLPVVPVDLLARVLVSAADDPQLVGENLLVFDERTPTLPGLLRFAAEHIGARAPRWSVPVGLLAALPRAVTGVEPESLSFLSPDRYDGRPLSALLDRAGISVPPLERSTRRWLDHLLDTEFLRRPARAGRTHQSAGQRVFARGPRVDPQAVLLHGVMLSAESWAPVLAGLPDHAEQLLVPELPGFGRSAAGGGEPADWMQGLLSEASRPPVLVGHSLGTAYAIAYARRHPERVRALVLVAPFFLQDRPSFLLRQAWLMGTLFRHMSGAKVAATLDGPLDAPREEAAALLRRPEVARSNARGLAWAAEAPVRARLRAQLAELDLPTTLVVGTRDPLRFEAPPAAHVIEVEGAGHYPQLTHPAAVAAAVHARLEAAPT